MRGLVCGLSSLLFIACGAAHAVIIDEDGRFVLRIPGGHAYAVHFRTEAVGIYVLTCRRHISSAAFTQILTLPSRLQTAEVIDSSAAGLAGGNGKGNGNAVPANNPAAQLDNDNDGTPDLGDTSGPVAEPTIQVCIGGGKSNNGHGNNADGVDSSNPDQGNGGPNDAVDASCTDPANCVDDENKGGASNGTESCVFADAALCASSACSDPNSPECAGAAEAYCGNHPDELACELAACQVDVYGVQNPICALAINAYCAENPSDPRCAP